MSNVTIKNTKQEIYDALVEAEEKVKALKEQNFNPAETVIEKANAETIKSAEESIKNNLFSEELSKKFIDLEAAIILKQKELEEMYEIDQELQNLTVIANAGKEMSAKIEADKAAKKAEYAQMTDELVREYAAKKKALEEEFVAKQLELKKTRDREIEEYEYTLKRNRSKENDDWADEKAKREAEIAALEAEAKAKFDEASEKTNYIKELEDKVEAIPELIEKAKEEAAEAARKEEAKEYGYKKAMTEKEHGYAIQRLEDKIDILTSDLNKANTLVDSLQAKLDNAYDQIRELATKTVESTGGVKILGSGASDIKK